MAKNIKMFTCKENIDAVQRQLNCGKDGRVQILCGPSLTDFASYTSKPHCLGDTRDRC